MAIEYRGEKFEGYNKPKRTPKHPKKSHAVLAKEGDTIKLIRFGEQGAKTAGKPKKGESDRMKKKRASFKARHGKNIKKGNKHEQEDESRNESSKERSTRSSS